MARSSHLREGMRALPFAFVALAAAPALADEALEPTQEAELSARLGSFLPLSISPATPASDVRTFGTYDGARKRAVVSVDTMAMFASWFQLQAGARYEQGDGNVRSRVLAQLGLLEDDKQGLDLQLGLGWQERGINDVMAGRALLAIGHELAHTYVMGSATFDLGERNERGLALNAAAIHAVRQDLYVGVDSRVQLDLERDADEPMNESTWDLQAGPVVTYAVRSYTVTASTGVATAKPRMASLETGMFGTIGLGAAF